MDIRCKKINCKYNDCFSCQAKGVVIESGLECSTFEECEESEKRNREKIKNSKMEFAGEIAPYKPNKTRRIECSAKCLFNKNGICQANGITVLDNCENGSCATNIKK